MLEGDVYADRLKAFVIDEAHCVHEEMVSNDSNRIHKFFSCRGESFRPAMD